MIRHRFLRTIASGVLLAAIVAGGAIAKSSPGAGDWRAQLSNPDRLRLRNWRDSWLKAVANARQRGGSSQIAAEGALLDPDSAIGSASPPSGDYKCRTIKVGSLEKTGPGFVAYPWYTCRIDGSHVARLTGSQRAVGDLHRDEAGRLVFIGAMALGDEQKAFAYGRDSDRDMVGLVDQLGPQRWRLIVPQPRWESLLDVTELVPAN